VLYVTGDFHSEYSRASNRHFPEQSELGPEDGLLVCGDFGFWHDSPEQDYWLKWWEAKKYPVLWCDGNHENFDALHTIPVEEWKGGRIQRIRSNVIRLCRGEIFDLDGAKIFVMGGAKSHDMEGGVLDPEDPNFFWKRKLLNRSRSRYRVKGETWWEEEMPSQEEYRRAWENLERAGWQVDLVITHCAPTRIQKQLDPAFEPDELTDFLDRAWEKLTFRRWYCGHYHQERELPGLTAIYERFEQAWPREGDKTL